jgi:hypothetical protein
VSSEGRMVTARREKRQSMGLSLNEGMVLPPGKIEAAAHGLADAGYGIVRTMLRSTNLTHRSAAVVDAVRRLTEVAHERGMLVVLDCEPHIIPVAYDMGEQFPEAMATRLLRGECKLINGNFLIHFPVPTSEGRNDFLDLEAVFIRDASGKIERLESIPFQLRFEQEAFRTGYTTAEDYYVEGKAGWFKHVPRIFGTLEDHLSRSIFGRKVAASITTRCWNVTAIFRSMASVGMSRRSTATGAATSTEIPSSRRSRISTAMRLPNIFICSMNPAFRPNPRACALTIIAR